MIVGENKNPISQQGPLSGIKVNEPGTRVYIAMIWDFRHPILARLSAPLKGTRCARGMNATIDRQAADFLAQKAMKASNHD